MMLMGKLRLAAAVAIVLGMSAIGIGALAGGPRRAGPEAATGSQKTAATGKGQAAPARKKPRPRPGDDSHRESITVSGRAIDPSGRPVAGATVYIIDGNRRMAR